MPIVAIPCKVRWRMTQRQEHWQLSYEKLSLLDRYHGRPTGACLPTRTCGHISIIAAIGVLMSLQIPK